MTDPIVAEIRAIRERIAEESGCNIHAIAEAARKRQQTSGVRTVSRPKPIAEREQCEASRKGITKLQPKIQGSGGCR